MTDPTIPLPESTHRLFTGDRHATLITRDPDGGPQVSLIWVAREGDAIVFGAEGSSRKIRNLRLDPHLALMIEDDRAGRFGLRQHLVVHGTAELTGPGIPETYTELMDTQSRRYLGVDFPLPTRGSRTAVIGRIHPVRLGGSGPWAP